MNSILKLKPMKINIISIFKKSYLILSSLIFIACFSLSGQQKEVFKDNIQADVNSYLGEYSMPIGQVQQSILLYKLNGKIAMKFFRPSEDPQIEEVDITTCTNLKIQGNRITCGNFSGRFMMFIVYCKQGKPIEVPGILEDGDENEISIYNFYSKNCLNVTASSTLIEPSKSKNYYGAYNVTAQQYQLAPNCDIDEENYSSFGVAIFSFPAGGIDKAYKGSGTWAEGVEGDGLNEWLKFDFVFPINITSIRIWNGLNKSLALFRANGRVKKVLITASNGEEKMINLRDKFEEQSIPVSFSNAVNWVKITILEVYPGLKYKDTCISGVTFGQENN